MIVGVLLGYKKIIYCGVPLDDKNHNGEPHWRKCMFEKAEAAGTVDGGPNSHWKHAAKTIFKNKVTSMSGRTKEWLGSPL